MGLRMVPCISLSTFRERPDLPQAPSTFVCARDGVEGKKGSRREGEIALRPGQSEGGKKVKINQLQYVNHIQS
jgi:hypothetical protein